MGDFLEGVGDVAEQQVANDAEPLEHVHAAADVHVVGRVHSLAKPWQQQQREDNRGRTAVHRAVGPSPTHVNVPVPFRARRVGARQDVRTGFISLSSGAVERMLRGRVVRPVALES